MSIKKVIKKIQHYSPISVGMRILKTGLATTLTATVGLTFLIGNPFYALMGAVLGMQNTVSNSFKVGLGRIIGTAIGAFIGFLFVYFNLTNPIGIGFAISLVIIICSTLKIQQSILITVTLCLLIMFNPNREGGLFNYAFFRTLDTTLGVIIGFLINRFVAPPDHLNSLITALEFLLELGREAVDDAHKLAQLKKELPIFMRFQSNYQEDKKYDKHDMSNENLLKTVEASQELYFHLKNFHFKNPDATIKHYHINEINQALSLLDQTLSELKGAK